MMKNAMKPTLKFTTATLSLCLLLLFAIAPAYASPQQSLMAERACIAAYYKMEQNGCYDEWVHDLCYDTAMDYNENGCAAILAGQDL